MVRDNPVRSRFDYRHSRYKGLLKRRVKMIPFWKDFYSCQELKYSHLGIRILGKGNEEVAAGMRFRFIEYNPNNNKYCFVRNMHTGRVLTLHRDFLVRAKECLQADAQNAAAISS
jgi:hypothetical protein